MSRINQYLLSGAYSLTSFKMSTIPIKLHASERTWSAAICLARSDACRKRHNNIPLRGSRKFYSRTQRVSSQHSALGTYVFISLGVLNLVCVSFLFLWKKWAFFALCGSAGTALVINLLVGVGAFAFVGLGGVVIFYLRTRSKWSLLSNF